MIAFLIGLVILIVGGLLYGAYCEKVFGPDDRQTPAHEINDGVDYVPMKKWKNSLIQLLNIAGTGPILGPIQGILFGPIAFILIPIGNILGGALHDYFSGMISLRNNGEQMPFLVKKFLGKGVYNAYNVFVMIVMLLVGAVFIYTPGDLFVTQILNQSAASDQTVVWIVYGVIFAYYLIATFFPIDKIIGKVYPIFGALLLLSTVGIFIGLFAKGYPLTGLTLENMWGIHPQGLNIIPIFFVTIACGIVSGFHATQSTMIARAVKSEKEGRTTFFNMMLVEGFIAMVWAAAAMGAYNLGIAADVVGQPAVVGIVAKDMFGTIGGIIAIIGVIVLPITSGDTALRSLRLMVAETLNYDQKPAKNRFILSACIFIIVAGILIFAKSSAEGFNILWRYFAWSNQTIAVFTFAMIAAYLIRNGKNFWIALLPGMFYMFIIGSYILNAKIGFNLSINIAYILGAIFTLAYAVLIIKTQKKKLQKS